jgi:hypothetical protein
MNTGTMCIQYNMRVSSYSKVDAAEQRYMVNSGVGGTKDRNLRTEVGWYSTLIQVRVEMAVD